MAATRTLGHGVNKRKNQVSAATVVEGRNFAPFSVIPIGRDRRSVPLTEEGPLDCSSSQEITQRWPSFESRVCVWTGGKKNTEKKKKEVGRRHLLLVQEENRVENKSEQMM